MLENLFFKPLVGSSANCLANFLVVLSILGGGGTNICGGEGMSDIEVEWTWSVFSGAAACTSLIVSPTF